MVLSLDKGVIYAYVRISYITFSLHILAVNNSRLSEMYHVLEYFVFINGQKNLNSKSKSPQSPEYLTSQKHITCLPARALRIRDLA